MATVAIHVCQKRSGIRRTDSGHDLGGLGRIDILWVLSSCSLFITEGNAHKHIRSLNRVLYLFRLSEERVGEAVLVVKQPEKVLEFGIMSVRNALFSIQAPSGALPHGRSKPCWGPVNQATKRIELCNAKLNTNQETSTEVMQLGRTELQVSRLGIGTLQWGDPGSGFGNSFGEPELTSAFDELVKGGINFFDTAEVYGYQNIKSGTSSEQLLGKFVSNAAGDKQALPPVIATKFFTIPWTNFLVGGGFRLGRKSLLAALRESLKRIGKEKVDLYQIHFPFPTFSNAALMESLKEAVEEGLTRAVGVSNYSKDQMEEADDLLARYGIPLASNQVQYSLANRGPEENGLLKACKERNIQLIAYSPLASGLLTDKALKRTDSKASKIQPLLELMKSIGAAHGNKSVSQVALNYLIFEGALPIAGCKNAQQAKAHCDTLKFQLTNDEVASLKEKAGSLRL